ncbi:MAG: ClbS/DfsB family four-helix bundle protein [Candidatus Dormibacterales bacterium]
MTAGVSLLARIDSSWAELSQLADGLGPGGLTVAGPDGWAVKDHLSHVAAWERWLIALLERRDRKEAMGLPSGFKDSTDEINAELWALSKDTTGAQAFADFRDTHAQLMSVLGRMSDADLELPYTHYEPRAAEDPAAAGPVTEWVAANTYDHYAEHIGWIRSLTAEGS